MRKEQEKYINLAKKQRLRKDIKKLVNDESYPIELYDFFFNARRYSREVIERNIPLMLYFIQEKHLYQGAQKKYPEFYKKISKYICKNDGLVSEELIELMLMNKYIANYLLNGGSADLIFDLYQNFKLGVKRDQLYLCGGSAKIDDTLCSSDKIFLEKRAIETFFQEDEYGELISYLFCIWKMEEERINDHSFYFDVLKKEDLLAALDSKLPYTEFEEFKGPVGTLGDKLLTKRWGILYTEFKDRYDYSIPDPQIKEAVEFLKKNGIRGTISSLCYLVVSKKVSSYSLEIKFYNCFNVYVYNGKISAEGKPTLTLVLYANGNINIIKTINKKEIARPMTLKELIVIKQKFGKNNVFFNDFIDMLESYMKEKPIWKDVEKYYSNNKFIVPVSFYDVFEAKSRKDILKKYKLYNDPEKIDLNVAYIISKCYSMVDDDSREIIIEYNSTKYIRDLDINHLYGNVKDLKVSGKAKFLTNILSDKVFIEEIKSREFKEQKGYDAFEDFVYECCEAYVFNCMTAKVKISLKLRTLFEVLSECDALIGDKKLAKYFSKKHSTRKKHPVEGYAITNDKYDLYAASNYLPKLSEECKLFEIPIKELGSKYRVVSDAKSLYDAAMMIKNFSIIKSITRDMEKGKSILLIHDNKELIKINKDKKGKFYCDDKMIHVSKEQKDLIEFLLN